MDEMDENEMETQVALQRMQDKVEKLRVFVNELGLPNVLVLVGQVTKDGEFHASNISKGDPLVGLLLTATHYKQNVVPMIQNLAVDPVPVALAPRRAGGTQ